MAKNFKSHMVLWAETGEGFRTVCGIDDGASERFKDEAVLTAWADVKATTCKKCVKGFGTLLTRHDKEVLVFEVKNGK